MQPPQSANLAALPAARDLTAAGAAWLGGLAGERRLSERTIEAYGRDARQFLAFLGERFGAPPVGRRLRRLRTGPTCARSRARRRGGGNRPLVGTRALGLRSPRGHIARNGGDDGCGARRNPRAEGRRAPYPDL